jgi:hypothetical protein
MCVVCWPVQTYVYRIVVLSGSFWQVVGKTVVVKAVNELFSWHFHCFYRKSVVPSMISLFLRRRVCNVTLSTRVVSELIGFHEKIISLACVLGFLRISFSANVVLLLSGVSRGQVSIPCEATRPLGKLTIQKFSEKFSEFLNLLWICDLTRWNVANERAEVANIAIAVEGCIVTARVCRSGPSVRESSHSMACTHVFYIIVDILPGTGYVRHRKIEISQRCGYSVESLIIKIMSVVVFWAFVFSKKLSLYTASKKFESKSGGTQERENLSEGSVWK